MKNFVSVHVFAMLMTAAANAQTDKGSIAGVSAGSTKKAGILRVFGAKSKSFENPFLAYRSDEVRQNMFERGSSDFRLPRAGTVLTCIGKGDLTTIAISYVDGELSILNLSEADEKDGTSYFKIQETGSGYLALDHGFKNKSEGALVRMSREGEIVVDGIEISETMEKNLELLTTQDALVSETDGKARVCITGSLK